ncbi:restriction endonuclease subunit S [Dinghuibacter silviterrae]|uniref:Restriction endonuclease S subunit n=1 Tax=Dinghuibacter silviterrae TaxID=1539049 RepID=A0A4R8DJI8_9BACT|nr:restriction endonuclease subunit S [Dinghuibacter silviterrae]TDW97160.1 restriction endonuclease S subunit [Dinghuibacter silviterrae]
MSQVKLGHVLIEQRTTVGKRDGDNLPLIGVSNKDGLILSQQQRLADLSRYKLLKANWFAYNPMRINVGSIGLADSPQKIGIISPDYVVFSCNEKIAPEYLLLFIKSDIGLFEIAKNTGGSVRERLYFKNLSNISIKLPCIEEQYEILASLNRRKSSIEQINNCCLELQLNDIPELRQAILQEAIQGKLTQQDETEEPSDKNIQYIKAERRNLVVDSKVKSGKELSAISQHEIPFELPMGWGWHRLGELGHINPRNVFADNKDVSFVPMALISSNFGEAPKFEIRKWSDVKTGFTHFAENDVAVAKITPCFENSKAGIFKGLVNGVGAGTTELHIFRGDSKYILPEYVYLFFKSSFFLKNGERKMTGSAGQKRVSSDFIKSCLFPLPPLSEQHRIVAKVQQLLQTINQLEHQISETQTQAQELLQSSLTEVFGGSGKVHEAKEVTSMSME